MKKRGKRGYCFALGRIIAKCRDVYRYNRVESTKERKWSNMERIVWLNVLKNVDRETKQCLSSIFIKAENIIKDVDIMPY